MKYGKIRKKEDETYIIEFNGMPFHVTPDYPPASLYGEEMTWEFIKNYAGSHPEETEDYAARPAEATGGEPPASAKIAALERRAQSLLPYIQADVNAEEKKRELKEIMLEIESLKNPPAEEGNELPRS